MCALPKGTRVYPRPRGEYVALAVAGLAIGGLPPPTRGIQHIAICRDTGVWSTPAHAGNTLSRNILLTRTKVYPRPRGEYLKGKPARYSVGGLPPPTRGILNPDHARARQFGSTPAHAGNTRRTLGIGSIFAVYPRPRGEYRSA